MKYLAILPVCFLLVTTNSVYAGHDEDTTKFSHTGEGLHPAPAPVTEEEYVSDPPPVKKEAVTEDIFVVVDEQPQFPGGNTAMMKFLGDSIRYPVEAQKKGIQGRVICNFVVMKDGSLDSVNVVRGVDPLLDAEAVRIIKKMPKWIPAKHRGEEVNVRFTLPIVFRLQGDNPRDEILTKEDKEVVFKLQD